MCSVFNLLKQEYVQCCMMRSISLINIRPITGNRQPQLAPNVCLYVDLFVIRSLQLPFITSVQTGPALCFFMVKTKTISTSCS